MLDMTFPATRPYGRILSTIDLMTDIGGYAAALSLLGILGLILAEIVTRNNLTVGLGGFSVSLPGDHRGDFPLPGGAIEPESLDFTPPAILRGRVDKPDGALGELLTPRAEFALPIGTQPLAPPAAWAPGAFQSRGMVTRQPAGR